jgi:hypothetical protein
MKFKDVETTFICQLNKPENRAVLEGYKNRKDKSGKELAQYYRDIFNMLKNTPAYGVSGVNKMLNELTASVRATLNKERKGKTSAYAHAGKILSQLDYFKEIDAVPTTYKCKYKLAPVVTEDELNQLELLV